MSTLRQLQMERAKFRRESFSHRQMRIAGLSKEEIGKIPVTGRFGLSRYLKKDVEDFLKNKRGKTYQAELINLEKK